LNSDWSAPEDPRIDPQKLPAHVAIIMDGNGRWAKKRLLNRIQGHEKGADAVRAIVRACRRLRIGHLTLYAFSTENWQRPRHEIEALMVLLKRFLKSERKELRQQNIRLNVIGQMQRLPEDVQAELRQVMTDAQPEPAMVLHLALSYGGRGEIVQMVRTLARKVKNGEIEVDQIDEQAVTDHLYTRAIPDPDILIRTSGEMRISNFLLWQIAYTELFVTQTLWPDFSEEEFIGILQAYQQRDRRYGKISD
jgi:undecaprenyl diphosphate synthase